MKKNHILCPKWAIANIALIVSGSLSPLGMRMFDRLGVKAPLSDIILTVILAGVALVVYCLISRCWNPKSFSKELDDGN